MAKALLSVGLDVGTTSTQMIVSRLTVENKASAFAVPELDISERTVLYRSPVHFTPLLGRFQVDGSALKALIQEEYRRAGITQEAVDTGAVIITGETSRKENARAVTEALAEFAGDFVVAAAGPDLESVLAAKGAGAVARSRETEQPILHMDIGGGTANLALIQKGKILRTGCLNVGGRLVKYGDDKIITYVSPVLEGMCALKPGDTASEGALRPVAKLLAQALEAAAGMGENSRLLTAFATREAAAPWKAPEEAVIPSFSGGVADCIGKDFPWDAFGDLGPVLGQAIRETLLCRNPYDLGEETIRATVIGAGCHSAMLSGSTVFMRNIALPRKGLAAVPIESPEDIPAALKACDDAPIFCITAPSSYRALRALAREIAGKLSGREMLLCMESDAAKALGQAIALEAPQAGILCIDRIRAEAGSFLDVGAPVGPALPVIVKTLILER